MDMGMMATWLESPELVPDPPYWFPECGTMEVFEEGLDEDEFKNPYDH